MKSLIVLLVVSFLSFGIQAQDHVFKVLASKACAVKKGNEWPALLRGANLMKTTELKITEGGVRCIIACYR